MTERLPDQLESEARIRHYVDGVQQTSRRGINWPVGTTVTDDPVEEKADLEFAPTTGSFMLNQGSFAISGTDWATVASTGPFNASENDALVIGFHYNVATAETDNAYAAFQFNVNGTPSASTGFVDGEASDGLGVAAWLATGTANAGGAVMWQLSTDDLYQGTVTVDFLVATDGADRTADSSSYYVANLGRFT